MAGARPIIYYYNDEWHTQGPPFEQIQRGFCYGDGIFETMRVSHGRLHLAELHEQRAIVAAQTLGLDTTHINATNWQAIVDTLTHVDDGVLRWYLTRDPGYSYRPINQNCFAFLSFATKRFEPRAIPIHILKSGTTLVHTDTSAIKTLSSIPYILATQTLKLENFVALICNEDGYWVELENANVFMFDKSRKTIVATDTARLGGRNGIVAKQLELRCASYGYTFVIDILSNANVKSDAIFFATNINALYSIRSVNGKTTAPMPTHLEQDLLQMSYL